MPQNILRFQDFIRPLLLVGVLVGIFTPASMAGPSEEAETAFQKADTRLNALYKKMLIEITRAEARENFIVAERAWIAFRDAQSELHASLGNRGGIVYAYDVIVTKTELTEARIQQLENLKKDANPDFADF